VFTFQYVSFVACHIAATETSPAHCGEDGTASQSGVFLPVMEGFTRLSRLAVGMNIMDKLEWNTCLAK
jgi:hypothetical protein